MTSLRSPVFYPVLHFDHWRLVTGDWSWRMGAAGFERRRDGKTASMEALDGASKAAFARTDGGLIPPHSGAECPPSSMNRIAVPLAAALAANLVSAQEKVTYA